MEENKKIESLTLPLNENGLDTSVIYVEDGTVSIFDGDMKDVKNFESILLSVNKNLVFLDGHSSINTSELLEYTELKERIDGATLDLKGGDCIVFTVKKTIGENVTELKRRGIDYVIAIVTSEWVNGLNRQTIVEEMDKGVFGALQLAKDYDIETIAVSNIFPYMPTALVMDLLSHYIIVEGIALKELCVVRGSDLEAIYRVNMLVHKLLSKGYEDIYIRSGGDLNVDVFTKMLIPNISE